MEQTENTSDICFKSLLYFILYALGCYATILAKTLSIYTSSRKYILHLFGVIFLFTLLYCICIILIFQLYRFPQTPIKNIGFLSCYMLRYVHRPIAVFVWPLPASKQGAFSRIIITFAVEKNIRGRLENLVSR